MLSSWIFWLVGLLPLAAGAIWMRYGGKHASTRVRLTWALVMCAAIFGWIGWWSFWSNAREDEIGRAFAAQHGLVYRFCESDYGRRSFGRLFGNHRVRMHCDDAGWPRTIRGTIGGDGLGLFSSTFTPDDDAWRR